MVEFGLYFLPLFNIVVLRVVVRLSSGVHHLFDVLVGALNRRIKFSEHLFDLRSQAVTEKLEDPTQIGKTRKQIARLNTILREKQLAESQPAGK